MPVTLGDATAGRPPFRPGEMGSIENPLHKEYLRLIEDAAARGLTAVHGLTPREQARQLSRTSNLADEDLDELTEILETSVYGESDEGGKAGIELCRRLSRRIRSAAAPAGASAPPPEGPARDARFRSLAALAGRLVPVLLGVALVGALLLAPRRGGSCSSDVSSASGHRGRGSNAAALGRGGGAVEGISPWPCGSERDSIAAHAGPWKVADFNAYTPLVEVPKSVEGVRKRQGPSFDADTGTDPIFRGFREPFEPPLSLHHRTEAYCRIDADYVFGGCDAPLREALDTSAEGRVYEANVLVALRRNEAIPIPTPSPEAMVVGYEVEAGIQPEFSKDPDDCLRITSQRSGLNWVRYWLAMPNDYHFAPIPDSPWEEFTPNAERLPANVKADADEVLAAIGGLPAPTFRATVRRLQAYCSGFSICPIYPEEERENAFLTVALARKGCCRHRSYVFFVLANALGIRTRYVHNEIHAFDEIQLPGGPWRQLDFRLLDSPDGPLSSRTRAGGENGLSPAVLLIMLSLLLVVGLACYRHHLDASAHLLAGGGAGTRAERRALRDRSSIMGSEPIHRLARLALERLDLRLENAGSTALPEQLRISVGNLRAIVDRYPVSTRLDRFLLDETYWSAKTVLHFLRKERIGEHPSPTS